MTKEKFKDVPMFKSLLINFIDINTLKTKNHMIFYISTKAEETICQEQNSIFYKIKKHRHTGIPWWSSEYDSVAFIALAWVESLIRELRSHKSCGTAKNTNKQHHIKTLIQ